MKPPSVQKVSEWMEEMRPKMAEIVDRGAELTRKDLKDIVKCLIRTISPSSKELRKPESTSAAMSALLHLEGQKVGLQMLMKNINRMLANLHFLYEGMEIPEWDGTRESAAVAFIGVRGVDNEASQSDRYIVKIKLKSGLCAGIITCAVLPRRSIALFLLKTSGTSKSECAVEEIAGMEATLTVSLNDHGLLQVHEWSCSDDQKRHNRDIASRRRDVLKCEMAPSPCNVCMKTIMECPLAVWLPKPKGEQ